MTESDEDQLRAADSTGVEHTITQQSRTTIGAAIGVGLVGLSACLWLNNTLKDGQTRQALDHQAVMAAQTALTERMARLELSINDRWSETEMRAWVRELRASNPTGIVVPAIDGR